MNKYAWDTEKQELIITYVEYKTVEDIKQIIELNKPAAVIDKFIELYIPMLDPAQQQADDWYANELTLADADINEPRKQIVDDNGIVTGEEPNAYDVALAKRTELETANEWLKGFRGIATAPVRPAFTMTVEDFKTENAILFDSYNKKQGASINGATISLNESNQNGIAAVLTGLQLADKAGANIYPINFKAESASGDVVLPFANLPDFETFAMQFIAARQAFFS